MMVPGSNLLAMAMGVIGTQTVQWHKFLGRATNAAGFQVSTYADPVPLRGSVQPVPRVKYEKLGLNFAREYVTLIAPADIITVGRDASGDKIVYQGRVYLCEDRTDWHSQDGWQRIVAVRVPA